MPKLRLTSALAYSVGAGFTAGDIVDATEAEAERFIAAGLGEPCTDGESCGSISGGRDGKAPEIELDQAEGEAEAAAPAKRPKRKPPEG